MKKYTYLHTPIGLLEIEELDEKLSSVNFAKYVTHPEDGSLLLQEAKWQLEAYFEGKRKYFDLPLAFDCSEFHKEVYQALMNTPYGSTLSYKELASLVGNPSASRAVGVALSNNPFPIIVPCHRVLKSDGSLGDYTGGKGVKTKKWLLEHEKGILA
jgi:O-6-methylguanine DNA methyltransferase